MKDQLDLYRRKLKTVFRLFWKKPAERILVRSLNSFEKLAREDERTKFQCIREGRPNGGHPVPVWCPVCFTELEREKEKEIQKLRDAFLKFMEALENEPGLFLQSGDKKYDRIKKIAKKALAETEGRK